MSHSKERKEKNCLNCNAVINGKYCSICGQENLEPQESIWSLVVHFFNDITHFDGKFFSSVKYVVTKPGFLTAEYARGRRMSYLNPVRFYVFTSFLFFFLFFTFFLEHDVSTNKLNVKDKIEQNDSLALINILKDSGIDSLTINDTYKKTKIDSLKNIRRLKKDKKKFTILNLYDYKDRKEFDSLNKIGKTDHGVIANILIEKQFQLQEKYEDDPDKAQEALVENALHSIPQTLFFTLPLFALVLQMLYFRRGKYYYVSHVIFTIHLYIFIYIDFLLMYFLEKLSGFQYLGWLSTVEIFLGIGIFYYAYRAMRNFYEQGRWKTIIKLFILCFSLIFLSVIFAIIIFSFSIFKM